MNNDAHSANDVACWDCDQHATERLEEMFVNLVQGERIARGQNPALRTVFLKQHGVAYGHFEPTGEYDVGIFGQGTKPLWMRFSSDTQPSSPDLHSTMGVGIKLFDVEGGTLMGDAPTADFIMQNHDVFFVDDAAQMCEFTTAGVIDGDYPSYLVDHPAVNQILNDMKKAQASCLTADYWAILPFAFGDDYVKYRLRPVDAAPGEPFDNANYLGIDLASRLRRGHAHFAFDLQFRHGDEPLDEASVRWSGEWVTAAHLHLPQQDIEARGQSDYGQHLAFNIWRTPAENTPVGSIAEARRGVYQGSADQRRTANGIPLQEPDAPGPHPGTDTAAASKQEDNADNASNDPNCIVSAAIYPPIGICRVGNSREHDGFYIGPEVPDPAPKPVGFYRDKHGHLKREAARFRVYGMNAMGDAVCELTSDNADIEWKVQLGNQKSSWYEFQLALDIPEAASVPPSLRRNPSVSDRETLTISPSMKHVSGPNHDGKHHRFDDGSFLGTPVYLGELRTDDAGRLIVLGGHGVSASHTNNKAVTFANNDGWHDDVSDGPVDAKVSYQGVELRVKPAWVACAPPNYAPQLKSVRTMWDLMRDTAVSAGTLARPERPSFSQDILPIFERMTRLQWVNAGFAAGFGFNGAFDFSTPEWAARLGNPSGANIELRRVLVNNFRNFDRNNNSAVPWPWLYGDAMSIPPADTPRQHATLSDLQLWMLDQWMLGNFDADYDPNAVAKPSLDDYSPTEQPDALTKAAMDFCLADAFHPGCEMTWPMRNAPMYSEPFRLKHRPGHQGEPSYGAQIDSTTLSLPDGPIAGGQTPGSITRWMAIPWQTDTASCRSGYSKSYDPYLPTFWPARVPNQVLTTDAYETIMDTSRPIEQRLEAFANRLDWDDPLDLTKSYTHQINHMIAHFDQMGVVEVREGPGGELPAEVQVSDQHLKPWESTDVDVAAQTASLAATVTAAVQGGSVEITDLSGIDKVRRFER